MSSINNTYTYASWVRVDTKLGQVQQRCVIKAWGCLMAGDRLGAEKAFKGAKRTADVRAHTAKQALESKGALELSLRSPPVHPTVQDTPDGAETSTQSRTFGSLDGSATSARSIFGFRGDW